MKKQTIRIVYFFSVLTLMFSIVHAQVSSSDLLKWTLQHLANGDCDKAQETYEQYKNISDNRNFELEHRITECKDKHPLKLDAFEPYIYCVKMTKITLYAPEGSVAKAYIGDYAWTYSFGNGNTPFATGFITSDGKFITARHVVEPWAYVKNLEDWDDPMVNAAILLNAGASVEATIVAENKTGDRITFKYADFTVIHKNDYAYCSVNRHSKIELNSQKARNLSFGTHLDVLSYSNGNCYNLQHTYATISESGPFYGTIPVDDNTFPISSSGGPVFCKNKEGYYVIGFLSSPSLNRNSQILSIPDFLSK